MKKYYVWKTVNCRKVIGWHFKTLKGAKTFFDAKASELPALRERRNQDADENKKFDDNECWGYTLYAEDVDGNECKPLETFEMLDVVCMDWKEVKEYLGKRKEAIEYLKKLGFTLINNKKNRRHFRYQNTDVIGRTLKDMLDAAYYKAQACLELAGIKFTRWRTDGVNGFIDVVF